MEQWTIREQLILGSAVQRSGDQNWVSVSRTIRPLSEENRQPDFYSQKNCAMHYAVLLDSASTPKRKKKRGSESETGETTQDLIVRGLTEKRLAEINQLLDSISSEYSKVKEDLDLIEKGQLGDDEITSMWNKVKDIDYNDITISRCVSQKDEENEVHEQRLASTSDKGQLETTSFNEKPTLSLNSRLVTNSDASKVTNTPTPLIATPIITPVANPATLIKIEPNIAMETLGSKPVQVKVLSHDDHTYSSPGPATLLTTAFNSEATSLATDETVANQATVHQVTDSDDGMDDTTCDQTSDSQTVSSADQITDQALSNDHTTDSIDRAIPNVDHSTTSVDQSTPSVDQSTANTDHLDSVIDRSTPSVDQSIPNVDQSTLIATSSVDLPTLSGEELVPSTGQHSLGVDQTTPKVADQDATESRVAVDQVIPTDNHSADQIMEKPSNMKATKSAINQAVDDQMNPANQVTSNSDHAAHIVDQPSQKLDHHIDVKAEIDQVNIVITSTVNNDVPADADQTTPTLDRVSPLADQGDTNTNQKTPVSDQTVPTIEKKSRTRGSNRITGKMKMAQANKTKAVKASSPRTMVIIGKQQSAVESDNEEIQVHYKEPTRRIYRLMSNEPSESEEEPLSTLTSAMTSPSSSMMEEMDPEVAQSMKLWRKSIMLVWQHASQHKFASLFLHAVKDDEATGYSEVVFRPMDLSLIKKKIETGVIRNDMEFQRDMLLMFQNALMYNSSNHDVFTMADKMRKDVMENIQDYLATQLMVHSTARTKILRSRDSRRAEQDEEVITPLRKTRHRLPSDESVSSVSGPPLAKKLRTRTNDE